MITEQNEVNNIKFCINQMIKQKAILDKKDFKIFHGDVNYFAHIYGIHNEYEIAFEPCDKGFDIALYLRSGKDYRTRELIGYRLCTKLLGYDGDPLHEKARGDNAWSYALEIANRILEKRLPRGIER